MDSKILLAQLNFLVGDLAGNLQRIISSAQRARDCYNADMVVFPELALTGYPPEDLLLRPEFAIQVETVLATLMTAVPEVGIVVGYPRRYGAALYNCAGVIKNGHLLGEYRKQELPNYGVFDELRYFQPGNGPCVVELQGLRFGLTICEDIWLPAPAQQARDAGAEILININASPFHIGKQVEREVVVRQRITEVGIPVLYVNQVGGQDELVFDGGSLVLGQSGMLMHRGPHCKEAELVVTISTTGQPQPGVVHSLPSTEAAIYQALVLGVHDYVRKNKFAGTILGLSGGIDSALTLAIATDALGADQVQAVLMPSRYTAAMSNADAIQEAQNLGVKWSTISIESAFTTFLELLNNTWAGVAPVDITVENLQARCRGVIMMALSNNSGKILLTTGNKSELAVGYATLYGDMAGGFAPIKDVFKTRVYQLAHYRNGINQVIPQRVLERAPSAELHLNQTDQDSLPPYDVLDAILQRYVEQDLSAADICAEGFAADIVQKVVWLVDRNEYKRRQAPPGVRISTKAFGRDRRYPLTCGFASSIE